MERGFSPEFSAAQDEVQRVPEISDQTESIETDLEAEMPSEAIQEIKDYAASLGLSQEQAVPVIEQAQSKIETLRSRTKEIVDGIKERALHVLQVGVMAAVLVSFHEGSPDAEAKTKAKRPASKTETMQMLQQRFPEVSYRTIYEEAWKQNNEQAFMLVERSDGTQVISRVSKGTTSSVTIPIERYIAAADKSVKKIVFIHTHPNEHSEKVFGLKPDVRRAVEAGEVDTMPSPPSLTDMGNASTNADIFRSLGIAYEVQAVDGGGIWTVSTERGNIFEKLKRFSKDFQVALPKLDEPLQNKLETLASEPYVYHFLEEVLQNDDARLKSIVKKHGVYIKQLVRMDKLLYEVITRSAADLNDGHQSITNDTKRFIKKAIAEFKQYGVTISYDSPLMDESNTRP